MVFVGFVEHGIDAGRSFAGKNDLGMGERGGGLRKREDRGEMMH